jgi:hypothetical protein
MTATLPRLLFLAAVAAPAFAAPGLAAAQGISANTTTSAPGGVNGGGTQQSIKGLHQAPTGEVFGTPVVVNTPVLAPYNADSTYTTYQGQPANGPSAMLAATVQGAP